jgi:hypothetical protein
MGYRGATVRGRAGQARGSSARRATSPGPAADHRQDRSPRQGDSAGLHAKPCGGADPTTVALPTDPEAAERPKPPQCAPDRDGGAARRRLRHARPTHCASRTVPDGGLRRKTHVEFETGRAPFQQTGTFQRIAGHGDGGSVVIWARRRPGVCGSPSQQLRAALNVVMRSGRARRPLTRAVRDCGSSTCGSRTRRGSRPLPVPLPHGSGAGGVPARTRTRTSVQAMKDGPSTSGEA